MLTKESRLEHRSNLSRTAAIVAVAAALAAGALLQACANSILRNASEAGLESALDDPLPTPARK